MKQVWNVLIVLICTTLLLNGCRASQQNAVDPGAEGESTTETQGQDPTETVTLPDGALIIPNGQSDLPLVNQGKARLGYTGIAGTVRYITSPEQILQYEALRQYDAAFFREHALILVIETVTSGNTDIEISGVLLDGKTATVKLYHRNSSDASTMVMTTWLLWAEVDAGLDYVWHLENPAISPDVEKY